MQATLASQATDLGMTTLLREFPAYRGLDGSRAEGRGRRGFIDFLAIDSQGRFHIVETKVGHDPRVVLQALDYAIWVRANETELRARLRAEGLDVPTPKPSTDDRLHLHLVLAPGKNGIAFNGYLAPQIDALTGDCSVQVHLVPDPAATPLKLNRLSAKDVSAA